MLVVSPAGPLLVQWAQELRQRFGLRFTAITDAAALQQQRRRLELGGNPFHAIALCLVSLDFAKQARVLEELERSAWDLAIIDEAHHCVGSASTIDRDDTQRRRLAEVVARRSDGLLLTATPHDGFDPLFASLIELLDPSLVDTRDGLAGTAYRRRVVRRLKSHVRDPATGASRFRERRVIPVRVEIAAEPVRRFHQALAALIVPRLRRAVRQREFADAPAFVGLLKRSVSTIDACVNTLRVVAERYLRADEQQTATLRREGARALLSRELHMTDDARSFALVSAIFPRGGGHLPLHEGKTIHQFSDRWNTRPRYVVALSALARKPQTAESTRHYRAACREVAGATNERTAIVAILPPAVLCGHTISVERRPAQRSNAAALILVALMNSFSFDWLLRQRAAAHVGIYILADLPAPNLGPDADRFLAHGCLRLCCNHRGFAALWAEQLGNAWHEASSRRSWPVIAEDVDRWRLRAAMDAIVAHVCGLDLTQYKRILASFTHKSFPAAPALCLAAFDERANVGLPTFCRADDPYRDVPLVTTIAKPAIGPQGTQ